MQSAPKAALLLGAAIALLVQFPRELSAQSSPPPKPKNGAKTTTTASTGTAATKGSKSDTGHKKFIEVNSIQFGVGRASNVATTGTSDKEGKISPSQISVNKTTGATNPAYKGPLIVPPKGGSKPKDTLLKQQPR